MLNVNTMMNCNINLMDQEPHLHFPNMLSMVDIIERYNKEQQEQQQEEEQQKDPEQTNNDSPTSHNSKQISSSSSMSSTFTFHLPTLLHIKNTGDATTIPGPIQEQFFNIVLNLNETEKVTTRLGKRTIINSDPYWRNTLQIKDTVHTN